MTKRADERIWERALAGQHTVVLGRMELAPPESLRLLRVSCDVPHSTLGPIADACGKAARVLGEQSAFLEQARALLTTGLRRRFLGDVVERGPVTAALIEVCHRLAPGPHEYVLVFDAVDAADRATLDSLARLIRREQALPLPLVLGFRERAPGEPAARLIGLARERFGEEALVHAAEPVAERDADEARAFHWLSLPIEILQVLRAGALIGSGFEADLVAELLECSAFDVLDCLQQAADAGAPIEDRGEGCFFLAEADVAALVGSMLPSLRAAWHRRLGWLLAAEDDDEAAHVELPAAHEGTGFTDIEAHEYSDTLVPPPFWEDPVVEFQPAGEPPRPRPLEAMDYDEAAVTIERPPVQRFAEVFQAAGRDETPASESQASAPEPAASEGAPEETAGEAPESEPESEEETRVLGDAASAIRSLAAAADVHAETEQDRSRRTTLRDLPAGVERPRRAASESQDFQLRRRDPARAASHLSAAGQIEAAAQEYANAAGEASAIGAYEQAMVHGRRALELVEGLPDTPERRRFRAELMLALGRLQWQAAGMLDGHPDPAFTLDSALDTACLAQTLLRDDDPADLVAEAHQLIASICYDLGTADALARALEELTRAARLLLTENRVTQAAQLLNDQAAVYVRLGDPVRATHLLTEAQKIFEQRAPNDPVATRELAETHHLLARLPLHAPIRDGREQDAYVMALEHAAKAEEKYQQLGEVREVARVWETRGRMELLRGQLDQAAQRLSSALEVQSQIGDLTGLARSTGALSDVLAASGRYGDALLVLGDSITLNREKGSPIGLAFNRRSLDKLQAAIVELGTGGGPADETVVKALADIREHLESAEAVLGRIRIASEL